MTEGLSPAARVIAGNGYVSARPFASAPSQDEHRVAGSNVDALPLVDGWRSDRHVARRLAESVSRHSGLYWACDVGRLILATDPLGVRPVFCLTSPSDGLVFFSRFDSVRPFLLRARLAPDKIGILEGMLLDTTVNGRTPFEQVRAVPPGVVLEVSLDTLSVREQHYFGYWRPGSLTMSPREAAGTLVGMLEEQVASLLAGRRALVPLSGGVDSRLLIAVAARVCDPREIVAMSFACRPNSYELTYASRVCEILGVRDHRRRLLDPDSYRRSSDHFAERLGGALSCAHGHLGDVLRREPKAWDGFTMLGGAYADAAGGYGVALESTPRGDVGDSAYARHLAPLASWLELGGDGVRLEDDLSNLLGDWKRAEGPSSFDEYVYLRERQSRVILLQAALYRDMMDVSLPFADLGIAEFLLRLPPVMRRGKGVSRDALALIDPRLARLPDVSSLPATDTLRHRMHTLRGKVFNNGARLLTRATGDRCLFFSPFQTECQDFNLRTVHRAEALRALEELHRRGVLSGHQRSELSQPAAKQHGGILAVAQYWAMTVVSGLQEYSDTGHPSHVPEYE